MSTATGESAAPLANYVPMGIMVKVYKPAPNVPEQPAGSCWHCGAAIKYCVQVVHRETGERHEVGTTCAERCGLDPVELRAMLREKFAADRAEGWERAKALREAEKVERWGEHGTVSRYVEGGCRCEPCVAVAPHGTWHGCRRDGGWCLCEECLNYLLSLDTEIGRRTVPWFSVRPELMLVRVSDGHVVTDARIVDGQYGARWRSDSEDVWLSVLPARRSTLTKHGYVEAYALVLSEAREGRDRRGYAHVCAVVEAPAVDRFEVELPGGGTYRGECKSCGHASHVGTCDQGAKDREKRAHQ